MARCQAAVTTCRQAGYLLLMVVSELSVGGVVGTPGQGACCLRLHTIARDAALDREPLTVAEQAPTLSHCSAGNCIGPASGTGRFSGSDPIHKSKPKHTVALCTRLYASRPDADVIEHKAA